MARRAESSKQFVAGAALVSVVVWPFPAAAQPTMAQDPPTTITYEIEEFPSCCSLTVTHDVTN